LLSRGGHGEAEADSAGGRQRGAAAAAAARREREGAAARRGRIAAGAGAYEEVGEEARVVEVQGGFDFFSFNMWLSIFYLIFR
jgi:hypothetical protein